MHMRYSISGVISCVNRMLFLSLQINDKLIQRESVSERERERERERTREYADKYSSLCKLCVA